MTNRAQFRRADRMMDALAAKIIRRVHEVADGDVAIQTAVEFLAHSLLERDEWLFQALLRSDAAAKIYEREVAEANMHPEHATMN